MAAFYYRFCQVIPLLYYIFCQVLALLYVKLYVYAYNPTYKCNNVAKIIYIVLHFVLCKVVYLCKQNTK